MDPLAARISSFFRHLEKHMMESSRLEKNNNSNIIIVKKSRTLPIRSFQHFPPHWGVIDVGRYFDHLPRKSLKVFNFLSPFPLRRLINDTRQKTLEPNRILRLRHHMQQEQRSQDQ